MLATTLSSDRSKVIEWGDLGARAVAANSRDGTDAAPHTDESDWTAVNLYEVLLARTSALEPDQLTRTDGASLIPRGSIATLIGESGAGKSWLSAAFGLEQCRRGEGIAVFDFEDSEGRYIERLVALGYTKVEIVSSVRYFNPYTALSEANLAIVIGELVPAPSLIIIDAATEAAAVAVPGASSNSSDDWARFMNSFVRPLRDKTGATILLIDHPVKDKESRRGYASGTQHKRASVDVALGLETVTPFGRGASGEAILKLFKDRTGHLRALANDSDVVGVVQYAAGGNGKLRVTIDPPTERIGAFRPTHLMEKVSLFVEGEPGRTVSQIRQAVPGNAGAIGKAAELLVTEGFLSVEQQGRSRLHTSVIPFRESDDA